MEIPEDQTAAFQAFVSSHLLLCIAKKCVEDASAYQKIKDIVAPKKDSVLDSVCGGPSLGSISISLYALTTGPKERLKGRSEYKGWETKVGEAAKGIGDGLYIIDGYPDKDSVSFASHLRNAAAHFQVFPGTGKYLISLKDQTKIDNKRYEWTCHITEGGLGLLIDKLTTLFMKDFGKAKG